MKETIPDGAHSLPNPQNLQRAANLHRTFDQLIQNQMILDSALIFNNSDV